MPPPPNPHCTVSRVCNTSLLHKLLIYHIPSSLDMWIFSFDILILLKEYAAYGHTKIPLKKAVLRLLTTVLPGLTWCVVVFPFRWLLSFLKDTCYYIIIIRCWFAYYCKFSICCWVLGHVYFVLVGIKILCT